MSEKKYIENPEEIRLNENQELQQILGNTPGWLLHWGNLFVLLGVAIFLALGWFVKYPDIVPARVMLTTKQPPIRVVAQLPGKLSELNVQDFATVEKGQILAVIENPANRNDVKRLDDFLSNIQNKYADPELLKIEIPRNLQLGNLQSAYANFLKSFDEHVFYLKNNNTYSKVNNLKDQIAKLEDLDTALQSQVVTLEQVVNLSKKELDRNRELKKIGAVSETELEASEAEYLRNRRQLENLKNDIINNKLLVEKTKMLILETNQDYTDGRSSGLFSIQEDIRNIQGQIDTWNQSYLIKAPIAGQVSMTRFQSSQQFINEKEELLTIVPNTQNTIIAKGLLLPRGSGKVVSGMRANIRLDAYPYQEFGSVEAEVTRISLIPEREGFQVELSIDQPIQTTYSQTILFQQEMQGTANIITEDRRILERIFDRVLSVLYNE